MKTHKILVTVEIEGETPEEALETLTELVTRRQGGTPEGDPECYFEVCDIIGTVTKTAQVTEGKW